MLPALSTRSRRRNRERRYDRFPSRKRERSPMIAGSHAAFLPSTKPEGANKELRTRAATSCKKRRDHFSRGRLEQNSPARGEHLTRWRAEIPPPEIFPENFRRVTLAYFGGSDSFASGFAAVYGIWQIRRFGTRTELIESTLREYVQSWGITSRHWQLHFISPQHF